MKRTTLLFLLFTAFSITAQEKFKTTSAIINFEASVPFFEEVKAVNKLGTIVLEPQTSTLICTVIIKDFRFKMDLMEEHFNENYIESSKFPKATFKGKIEDFDVSKITASSKDFTIRGKLELHGKSKDITSVAKIKKIGTDIEVKTNFSVNVSDFNIEIPSAVSKKVTKKITIDCNFLLK